MDEWTPFQQAKPTTEQIEEYMKSLKIEEEVGDGFYGGSEEYLQKANKKQVAGSHYQREIQPWDIIKCWGLGFWRGNVVKYVLRSADKNGKEDLEKAKHYLEFLIENYDTLDPKNM